MNVVKAAFWQLIRTPGTWQVLAMLTAYAAGCVVSATFPGNAGRGWALLGVMLVAAGLVYLSYVLSGIYAEMFSRPLKTAHTNLLALKRNIEHAAHAADTEWSIEVENLLESNASLQLQLDEALRVNADLRNPPGTADASLTTRTSSF